MTEIWYPVFCSQPRSNVGWDFPAKKHRCLSGQKVFLNVISSVVTAATYDACFRNPVFRLSCLLLIIR